MANAPMEQRNCTVKFSGQVRAVDRHAVPDLEQKPPPRSGLKTGSFGTRIMGGGFAARNSSGLGSTRDTWQGANATVKTV